MFGHFISHHRSEEKAERPSKRHVLRNRAAAAGWRDFTTERKIRQRRSIHRHAEAASGDYAVKRHIVRAAAAGRHRTQRSLSDRTIDAYGRNAGVPVAPIIRIRPDAPDRRGRGGRRTRNAVRFHREPPAEEAPEFVI